MQVLKGRFAQILIFLSGILNSGGLNSKSPPVNVTFETKITINKTVIRDSFNTTTYTYYQNPPEK